jgi:hypothetical protein
VAFRDDNDALRARVQELETQLADTGCTGLRDQLSKEQALRERADATIAEAIIQRDRALQERDRAQKHSRRMPALLVGIGIFLGTFVYGLSLSTAGCAHDIAVCSECPAPQCPQAPETKLGVQCDTLCNGLDMRQIAHFDHGDWYSCTCVAAGRMCEFHSDSRYPGNGAHFYCTESR